jgi:hypothetical protein
VLVVHFMRFTSNGYPQGSLFAFEYDTNRPHGQVEELVNDQLEDFLDDVMAQTGHTQVPSPPTPAVRR